MRYFTIVPMTGGIELEEVTAIDEVAVLYTVSNLRCDEAAVFEDDAHRYSLRLDRTGVWCIFHQENPVPRRLAHSQ